jgi:hypothetical protein
MSLRVCGCFARGCVVWCCELRVCVVLRVCCVAVACTILQSRVGENSVLLFKQYFTGLFLIHITVWDCQERANLKEAEEGEEEPCQESTRNQEGKGSGS